MKRIASAITVAWLALPAPAVATDWTPSDKFLRAICVVESSNGHFLYGDNGRSLGHFQLSEAAWLDVNSSRRSRGLSTYPYDTHVYNAYINRVYAAEYLSIIYSNLSRKLRRSPTSGELYAAYNMGLACFAQCRYQLERVNAVTLSKCRQISTLMESD